MRGCIIRVCVMIFVIALIASCVENQEKAEIAAKKEIVSINASDVGEAAKEKEGLNATKCERVDDEELKHAIANACGNLYVLKYLLNSYNTLADIAGGEKISADTNEAFVLNIVRSTTDFENCSEFLIAYNYYNDADVNASGVCRKDVEKLRDLNRTFLKNIDYLIERIEDIEEEACRKVKVGPFKLKDYLSLKDRDVVCKSGINKTQAFLVNRTDNFVYLLPAAYNPSLLSLKAPLEEGMLRAEKILSFLREEFCPSCYEGIIVYRINPTNGFSGCAALGTWPHEVQSGVPDNQWAIVNAVNHGFGVGLATFYEKGEPIGWYYIGKGDVILVYRDLFTKNYSYSKIWNKDYLLKYAEYLKYCYLPSYPIEKLPKDVSDQMGFVCRDINSLLVQYLLMREPDFFEEALKEYHIIHNSWSGIMDLPVHCSDSYLECYRKIENISKKMNCTLLKVHRLEKVIQGEETTYEYSATIKCDPYRIMKKRDEINERVAIAADRFVRELEEILKEEPCNAKNLTDLNEIVEMCEPMFARN